MIKNKKVEFNIRTLLSLEEFLNVPLTELVFQADITDEIQAIVVIYGLNLNDKELEEYLKLKPTDKLSVDLKVNSALLDAIGVGKQSNNNSSDDTENKPERVKFFREYIKSFRNYCVGVLHMSKDDFYSYTPVEIHDIIDAHQDHVKLTYQLNKIAHINAIGLTSSKKFKEINPFNLEDSKRYRKVDIKQKREDLDFLMNKVGGNNVEGFNY